MPVYLDNAATTRVCPEAARAALEAMTEGYGNPSSGYALGKAAAAALKEHRAAVAGRLGCAPEELVFTSCGTEGDNWAVRAAADYGRRKGRHIITTAIEHDAVLAPARRLAAEGVQVTYLAPNRQGFIEVRALEQALTEHTVLVSVQAANSEVGSIQPIADLARVAHDHAALFHTDAVQALGKARVNLQELDVDAASFSAHKVGGPKGAGALYLRARTPFHAYAIGGGQEGGRRSGTQNVAGIVGFAAAVHAATAMQEAEAARLRVLRDRLYERLGAIDAVEATVDVAPGSEDFLPNIVHVLVDGLESETLILRFDMQGFGVSGGSACSSHSLEPSHVLRSLGIDADRAHGALRISMGRYTDEADVEAFAVAMEKSLNWN